MRLNYTWLMGKPGAGCYERLYADLLPSPPSPPDEAGSLFSEPSRNPLGSFLEPSRQVGSPFSEPSRKRLGSLLEPSRQVGSLFSDGGEVMVTLAQAEPGEPGAAAHHSLERLLQLKD